MAEEVNEWRRDPYIITTDQSRFDLDAIHGFLSSSYWAKGLPMEVLRRALDHSLAFGILRVSDDGPQQVGFARVITDYATYAYVADVFVLPDFQRQGLAHWLMETIVAHPELQGLRRWMLATRDAHTLYQSVGFQLFAAPERWMERHFPNVYHTS